MGLAEHRSEIENIIIGTLVCRCDEFAKHELEAADFSGETSRETFLEMQKFHASGKGWDFMLLAGQAPRHLTGYLNDVTFAGDPLQFVTSLLPVYVQELKTLRGDSLISEVLGEMDAADPIAVAKEIQRRAEKLFAGAAVETVGKIAEEIVARLKSGEGALGITSGYIGIDKLTGGLRPKTLTIVGGRTSMGKSSFLANIALNVAGNGKRVHFQALEESSESIATRMLSNRGRISTMRISARNLDMEELDRVIRAAKNLSSHAIIIDETCGISSENICARIRKAHSAAPYDLVIIDHIQRIREREATRHMEISRAIQTFKNLAKEISTPVIVASQIARAAEDGRDARPELRNLKESGDHEQEADVVMLLYRPSYYDKNMIDKSSVEIAIGKNRDGPTGHVDLRWSPTVMEFHEDVRGEDQNGATEAGAHWSDR